MAEFQGPERLLRGMTLGESIASANGVTCYELIHQASGQRFVLKHIAIPASEEKLEALLLSGAYADRDEADQYYRRVAEEMVAEIRCNRQLSECPNILRFLSYQLVPREESVGYDLYTITSYQQSLLHYRSENAMSHLTALNMGIDLCSALEAIHQAGFVFQDLRPGNVFLTESGRFLLGDFGLASMQDMQFSSLPEQFRSEYSAPELGGVLTGLNPTIDIYSLGMLLYRIYNGYHAPFEDESSGVTASEERRRSGEALPAPLYADYELAAILGKACAFEPKDRYQTPTEFREALTDYMIRNAADDTLIVPPIVSGSEPLLENTVEEEPEPVRFANVEELSEDFKAHFSPDTAGLSAVISAVRKEEEKNARHRGETASENEPSSEAPAETDGETVSPAAPEPEKKTKKQLRREKKAQKKAQKLAAKKEKAQAKHASKTPPVSATKQKPTKKTKKKVRRMRQKRRVLGGILLGLLALVAAAVLLYCLTPLGHNLYEFDIVVDSLNITEIGEDSLKVEVVSNAQPGLLTCSCQDAYGNAVTKSVGSEPLVFTDLTPGTQYTVNLKLEGFHRLSGVTTTTAATVARTEILTFAATPAEEDGSVTLSLVVKDGATEPEEWTVSVEAEGEQSRSQSFSGHSVLLSGLSVGKDYTIRLVEPEGCSLVGQTELQYTPQAVIKADALQLENLLNGVATLRWRCISVLPEAWTLGCELPDGTETEQTIEETEREKEADGSYLCTAQVEGIEYGKTYVFRLDAEGMFQTLSYTLDNTLPYVANFTAEKQDNGIALHWDSAFAPGAGWVLSILPDGNETQAFRTVLTGSDYTLEYSTDTEQPTLLPNTDFRFVLSLADGQELLGQTEVEARSDKAPAFSGMRLDIMTNYTGLYKTPEAEEWDGDDLMRMKPRSSFSAQDGIEILLRNRSGVDSSDQSLDILYLVRDSAGKVVSFTFDRKTWNEMWQGRNWVGHLPVTPQEAGSYTVEIYFNFRLVKSLPFAITE